MKLKTILTIGMLCIFQNKTLADDTLVILSPHQTPQILQKQLQETLNIFAVQNTGESLTYLDGETGQTIARLEVPNDERLAEHQTARLNHNKAQLAKLGLFIKSADSDKRKAGAINLPLSLKEVARYYRHVAEIVVIGTARMDIEGLSPEVRDGQQYLLDSNITQSSRESIFGTADKSELLKGFRIHWWVSSNYEERSIRLATERFWHLWLHHQSGALVSYSSDKNAVFQNLKTNAQPLSMPYQLEMSPGASLQTETNIMLFDRPLASASLPRAVWSSPQTVRLGISWQGQTDLDIYASLDNTQPPVYFANKQEGSARHLKDIRHGGDGKTTRYETIIYNRSVVDLCKLVIGINHFGGAAPKDGIEGLLRVNIAGQIFEKSFVVGKDQGNKGRDVMALIPKGQNSPYSQIMKVTDITGSSQKECVA